MLFNITKPKSWVGSKSGQLLAYFVWADFNRLFDSICIYLIPRRVSVGTLRSNDSDSNENFKKAIGLITKTTILHMHLAFLCISLYTSDDRISSLFLNLDMVLRNSTLEGFTYIWQSSWQLLPWRLKECKFTFSATFCCHRHPRVLRSLLISMQTLAFNYRQL